MIAPWYLDEPFESMEEFEKFIRMLDEARAKKASWGKNLWRK